MTQPVEPRSHFRFRPGVLALCVALMLALPGAAFASSFTVKIKVTNHDPITCQTNWYVTFYITKGAQKLSGKVEGYYFTLGSSSSHLGGNQPAGDKANHDGDFTDGYFKDNIVFPSEAAQGETLTLNAVIKTSYGTQTVKSTVTPKAGTKQCKVNGH
jgi:hypothetical protein